MSGLVGGAAFLAACEAATPVASAKPAASAATAATAAPAAATAAPAPAATVNPLAEMTRQQILDAMKPFKGTKIVASLIGSSLPPKEQMDQMKEAGIDTEITPIPATQLFEKMIVDFAGGASSYDVVSYVVNDVGAFSQFLLDLKALNAKYGWPQDKVMDAFKFYGWYPDVQSGAQYGMAYDGDAFLLHYRTDAFTAAGLDPAKPPATYDEMLAAAEKLNGITVDGKKLVGFMPRTRRALNHTWWANFFAAYGGDWFTADWQPRINSPEAIASLEYAVKLLAYGPPNAADMGFLDVNNGWIGGDVAMAMHYQTMSTTAQLDAKVSKIQGKFAVAQLPAGPAGRRSAMVGGVVLGIPAKSKNAEAAYLWSRWLMHPDNIKKTSLLGTGVEPVWKSTFADAEFQKGFTDGKNGWKAEQDQAASKSLTLPNIPEWPSLQEGLDLALSTAYLKQKTAKAALDETASTWRLALGRAGYYRTGRTPYRPQS